MGSFDGQTMLVSGASRGIGLAIAIAAAREGANVALMAKTADPHPKLEGTIHTAAAAIDEAAGREGAALPLLGDVREEDDVVAAVRATVERFGGIDLCVNNASAISVDTSETLPMKRYDLMQDVNTRGTFLLTRTCAPHLRQGTNPHVLTLSPPLNLDPKWFAKHLGYTLSKFGMSMCTLGFAREFAEDGIACNSLWPRTLVATAAVQHVMGGDEALAKARRPEIMADSAVAIMRRDSRTHTGNFHIDDDVLAEEGVTDLSRYAGTGEPELDIFVDG